MKLIQIRLCGCCSYLYLSPKISLVRDELMETSMGTQVFRLILRIRITSATEICWASRRRTKLRLYLQTHISSIHTIQCIHKHANFTKKAKDTRTHLLFAHIKKCNISATLSPPSWCAPWASFRDFDLLSACVVAVSSSYTFPHVSLARRFRLVFAM